jgi:hypothetical protein
VTDLRSLVELVREDPTASRAAERLARRREGAMALAIVGLPASLAVVYWGVGQALVHPDGDSGRRTTLLGYAALGATALGIWALAPGRDEMDEVVNGWNERHPERPLELAGREPALPRAAVLACRDGGKVGVP